MSIAAISSSQLGGVISSLVSNSEAAGIVSAAANGGTNTIGASSGQTSDFTSLLQALATGDQSGAQTALQQLQTDLGSGTASSGGTATAASGSSATGPFSAFASALSSSLGSGDLQGALSSLTSYLVSIGQASGNAVNTSA